MKIVCVLFFSCLAFSVGTCEKYLLHCPCSGRIGNQLDHLLGTILLAQKLNSTLVLMPFIHYYPNALRATIALTQFESVFNSHSFAAHLSAITWSNFSVEVLKSDGWRLPAQRFLYCLADGSVPVEHSACSLPNYLPFNTYWKMLNVSFSQGKAASFAQLESELFCNLHGDTHSVVALMKPPGSSPPTSAEEKFQKYFSWSSNFTESISHKIPSRPYLAIHLRIGEDMRRSCSGIELKTTNLFSFGQCISHNISATFQNCLPSMEVLVDSINRTLREFPHLRSIYIATDSFDRVMLWRPKLSKDFPDLKFYIDAKPTEFGDLYLLDSSDVFLGSCVSSYSAFVTRARKLRNEPVRFMHAGKGYQNSYEDEHGEL